MIPAFWRVYAALVLGWTVFNGTVTFGPIIEARFAPVRIDQHIEAVERVEDRLCWTWRSRKVRDLASDNIDVFLVAGGDRMVISVFAAATGMPWRAVTANPLGESAFRMCATLPPHIRPDQRVRVEQAAFYPGLLGLYRLPLRLPDVVDPPP